MNNNLQHNQSLADGSIEFSMRTLQEAIDRCKITGWN